MKQNKTFLEIENSIKSIALSAIVNPVQNHKLGRNILMVNLSGTHSSILIYDETKGMSEIGTMRYTIRGGKVFVSEFEVHEEFQGLGIGRTMFEFALAHGDAMGATYAYGYAKPTNNVKGVSVQGKNMFKEEQKAIMEVYKKLGCSFDNPQNEGTIDKIFEQRWLTGEKTGNVSEEIKPILMQVVQRDKKQSMGWSKG